MWMDMCLFLLREIWMKKKYLFYYTKISVCVPAIDTIINLVSLKITQCGTSEQSLLKLSVVVVVVIIVDAAACNSTKSSRYLLFLCICGSVWFLYRLNAHSMTQFKWNATISHIRRGCFIAYTMFNPIEIIYHQFELNAVHKWMRVVSMLGWWAHNAFFGFAAEWYHL